MNLTGWWVGTTKGCKTPLHFWLVIQHPKKLDIFTLWEGELKLNNYFQWVIQNDENFTLELNGGKYQSSILDSHSFIVPKWVFERREGGIVPSYDVYFRKVNHGTKEFSYRMTLYILINIRWIFRLLGLDNLFTIILGKIAIQRFHE